MQTCPSCCRRCTVNSKCSDNCRQKCRHRSQSVSKFLPPAKYPPSALHKCWDQPLPFPQTPAVLRRLRASKDCLAGTLQFQSRCPTAAENGTGACCQQQHQCRQDTICLFLECGFHGGFSFFRHDSTNSRERKSRTQLPMFCGFPAELSCFYYITSLKTMQYICNDFSVFDNAGLI